MKKTTVLFILVLSHVLLRGQKIENIPGRKPMGEFDNVSVEKIADDSLSTTFLIWIKGGVKHHFHHSHTEHVYVIEGNGVMEFGDEVFAIQSGDYVLIPKGKVHAVTAIAPLKVISIQTPQWITEDRNFVPPIRRPHNE